MNIWKKIPLVIKILVLGGALVLGIATLKPKPKPQDLNESDPALTEVSVVAAELSTKQIPVTSQGTVLPKHAIDIVSEVAGRVDKVALDFAPGAFFNSGDVLLQIDARDYESALAEQKARAARAELSLAEEKGRAKQAQREWRDLGNQESNALFLRKPQIKAAEAELSASFAAISRAERDLSRTSVQLPFDGRIQEIRVNQGQYVSPGTIIASAYSADMVEIRLPLTSAQAALIDLPLVPGRSPVLPSVKIYAQVGGIQSQWLGQITRVDARIDERSRMYYAIAEIEQPFNTDIHPQPLLVGMYVEAEIEGKPIYSIIELPRSAVFKQQNVYMLDSENRIEQTIVEVLERSEDKIWIKADIKPGTSVVTNKQAYLSPGKEVTPVVSEVAGAELKKVALQKLEADRTVSANGEPQ